MGRRKKNGGGMRKRGEIPLEFFLLEQEQEEPTKKKKKIISKRKKGKEEEENNERRRRRVGMEKGGRGRRHETRRIVDGGPISIRKTRVKESALCRVSTENSDQNRVRREGKKIK